VVGHTTKVAFMLLCCVKTIKDVFITFQKGLTILYDSHETESITLLTISEITHLSKASIKAFPEKEIAPGQIQQLQNTLIQLQTGRPIQYILGYTEFYGLKFLVNQAVLIPRPETEELVEWALSSVSNLPQPFNLLDIGTGSGCIAISLKKNLPKAQVSAIDISPEALQTAKENAAINNVEVNFIQDDILHSKFKTQDLKLIISNPPYVTLEDKEQMHINVTNFEPHTALFVPEDDPLIFYKVIADFAMKNLTDNGLLFFEINESYGQETVDLLAERRFKDIELKKDMGNKYRMIKAVK
jgi:release factor glutamine methyltransferase